MYLLPVLLVSDFTFVTTIFKYELNRKKKEIKNLPGKHGLVADPKDDFNCEKPAKRRNKRTIYSKCCLNKCKICT